jgi:hypothetical protein
VCERGRERERERERERGFNHYKRRVSADEYSLSYHSLSNSLVEALDD